MTNPNMPSLLPGYDIFISYRHNDNQSGWITEFVNNLNKEIQATVKGFAAKKLADIYLSMGRLVDTFDALKRAADGKIRIHALCNDGWDV